MEFLSQIAEKYYKAEGLGIKDFCFVFPNRRAGLFFQKELGDIISGPVFSPSIMNIKDLFCELSGLTCIDRLDSLLRLFNIYIEISGSKETFDEFVFWGDVILGDFDDVDKYLIDSKKIFANIKDLKEIESDYSFLSPKQMEAVRTFWSNFLPVADSEKKEKFQAMWKILYPLYVRFRDSLIEDGLGYEGMIYRKTAEQITMGENPLYVVEKLSKFKGIVFVGFNALSSSEKALLDTLKKAGIADFYWDFSGEMITDTNNKSSLFIRENILRYPSKFQLNLETSKQCKIEIIGIPSAVGQARTVSKIISEVGGELNTAVVLPDESLLMPVLYSIPQSVDSVNVTMGYPLKYSSIISLMQSIIELQKSPFYYKRVIPVLRHNYVKMVAKEESASILRKIIEGNMVYIKESEFIAHPLLKMIFKRVEDMSDYLLKILEYLNKSAEFSSIEKEFIYFFYTSVSRLGDLKIQLNNDTYCRLLMQIVNSTSIPFKGEPLSGLQIMGVLETRALDFENVVICSMNDGVFPENAPSNSFIPFNLRKGFGLPDYEFKDGVTAYHFYRLISRSSKLFLLYDTRTEGMQTGEMSRFIHQLKYHYRLPVKENIVTLKVSSKEKKPIIIDKSDNIMNVLSGKFLKNGSTALSASSINTFLDCPLKFFFRYVKGVEEEESVAESVESDTFGSIFHKSMELIYKDFTGKTVTQQMLARLINNEELIDSVTRKAFEEIVGVSEIKGHNLLIQKVIVKYIQQTILYDKTKCPFEYISSESYYSDIICLENALQVKLNGIIDRLDKKSGTTRIVDYKTGKGDLSFRDVADLFDRANKKRNSIAFQMLFYALLYKKEDELIISPYLLRELFKNSSNLEVLIGKDIMDEYKAMLKKTLEELFDPSIPFVQTEIDEKCKYCPYSVICL